jgi:hypothetical protein
MIVPKTLNPNRVVSAIAVWTLLVNAAWSQEIHTAAQLAKLFLDTPAIPYPPQALAMHITGKVTVTVRIRDGRIVECTANGPGILGSAAQRWILTRWRPRPGVNRFFITPIEFRIGKHTTLGARANQQVLGNNKLGSRL